MTASDPHARYDELAVGHSLGSLEPEDEQVFATHLPACARCERAVAAHRDTMAHLAYAAEAASPPPTLWAGIRAGVEASGRPVAFPTGQAAAPDAQPVDDLAGARERRSVRRALVARVAAATSVAAAFALVLALVSQNVSTGERQREQVPVAFTQSLSQALETYDDGARVVPLRADGAQQAAAAAVVDGERLHLLVDELDVNDRSTSTYVLWGRSVAGRVRAVATFDVTGQRDVEVVPNLSISEIGELEGLVVTREAGRSAPQISLGRAVVAGTLA